MSEISDFSDEQWYAEEIILREYYDRLLAADSSYDEWLATLQPQSEQEPDHEQHEFRFAHV